MNVKVKPWCNYAMHRTVSPRKQAGAKCARSRHGASKRRDRIRVYRWWQQADKG